MSWLLALAALPVLALLALLAFAEGRRLLLALLTLARSFLELAFVAIGLAFRMIPHLPKIFRAIASALLQILRARCQAALAIAKRKLLEREFRKTYYGFSLPENVTLRHGSGAELERILQGIFLMESPDLSALRQAPHVSALGRIFVMNGVDDPENLYGIVVQATRLPANSVAMTHGDLLDAVIEGFGLKERLRFRLDADSSHEQLVRFEAVCAWIAGQDQENSRISALRQKYGI